MSANDLLIWMSARTAGSWQQFRNAVEDLYARQEAGTGAATGGGAVANGLRLHQLVRFGLERLAHVEFDAASEHRWRVVPPSLAVNRDGENWVGVVCGARPPHLGTAVIGLSGAVAADVREVPGMPDRLRLISNDIRALRRAGDAAGLLIQQDASAAFLAAIPPVNDPRSRTPAVPPSPKGWTVSRFSPTSLRWEDIELGALSGASTELFRFELRFQRFHYLRSRSGTFHIPVQAGKYAVLAKRRVRHAVQYDAVRRVLSVPVPLRPPLLIERALVLCSGLLPQVSPATGRLEYDCIPFEIARQAAALLCQEVAVQ